MEKIKYIIIYLTIINILNATTVYENGEDGETLGWRVQQNGEEAKNIFSNALKSRVIRLEGEGGPWILGAVSGDMAWSNKKEKWISWKMLLGDRYTIYIPVTTKNGTRYLFYNDLPKRILRHGFDGGILHGLGGYAHPEYKGVWRVYTRDLEKDLKDSEPDNELISINGFIYSGANVSLDDILLYNPKEVIYEDGTTPERWRVFGRTATGENPRDENISSIDDPQGDGSQGKVIKFQGDGLNSAYTLDINNSEYQIIQWKSRYYENYMVSIIVDTKEGLRELLYINSSNYYPSGGIFNDGYTIWHELGGKSLVGENGWEQRLDFGDVNHFWQSVTRDLNQDIKDFQRDNELISVKSIQVRGSGLFDDVKMISRPDIPDPREDIIYEDGEDGNSSRWTIYDNSPDGAKVINVLDNDRESRVIEFSGSGFNNGYEIGARRGDNRWENRDHKAISWSSKFSDYFTIYVAVDTLNGARYLAYEPRDSDRGVVANYIRFGIGEDAKDGTWKSIIRNLSEDIQKFEPDNRLLAINSLMVRGDGRIDDIKSQLNYKRVTYEDAEDGNIDGWRVIYNSSGEANITNIEDDNISSRVISLNGEGKGDGYSLGGDWRDFDSRHLSWDMNFNEDFTIYISLQTKKGRRYLTYTPIDENRGAKGDYLLIGLGSDMDSGEWKRVDRDLERDLEMIEPDNRVVAVDGFMVRGSGKVDNIEAY
ncbi:MAG: hypothetical protein GXO06_03335 [Epsilonproteobacteria bacterium]|nr:hypothetical protein [Campylobacterota bacterium]